MKDFFKTVFSFIYKFFNALNLVPALFVALVGLVLYVTGTLNAYPVITVIFQVLLVLTAIYAIVATGRKLLGLDKRVKKSKGMQIIDDDGADTSAETEQEKAAETEKVVNPPIRKKEQPKYFKLKQNPDYVMAEYSDRYELFLITEKGLKKIRTDYK